MQWFVRGKRRENCEWPVVRCDHTVGHIRDDQWFFAKTDDCLLYTSDAADERSSVDLGGRRIIKKKKKGDNIVRRRNDNNTETRRNAINLETTRT